MIGWIIRARAWGLIRTNPNHPRAAGYQPNQPGSKEPKAPKKSKHLKGESK